jgi:V/A-type H+-transporting ATPase subunit D
VAEIKLTKNDLRNQQNRLSTLEKYLPTLQLKKAMLQAVVNEARQQIASLEDAFQALRTNIEEFSALLTEKTHIDPREVAKVASVEKRYDNIAGVEVPEFVGVLFEDYPYRLFDTPAWVDSAIEALQNLVRAQEEINVAEEKKEALEKELRDVSIRVNLFEKILIPRALANIKKIKVFLGDQQLAAVSQAKAAKAKIEKRKMEVVSSWREAQMERIYAL